MSPEYTGPPLPPTPPFPFGYDALSFGPEVDAPPEGSVDECDDGPADEDDDSSADEDGDARYNPGGKADDMPPCGRWNLEHFWKGSQCKACKLALTGANAAGEEDIVDSLLDTLPEETTMKKRKQLESPTMTLKTPAAKKPDFFGCAVVDTPEKVERKCAEAEAGLATFFQTPLEHFFYSRNNRNMS